MLYYTIMKLVLDNTMVN